MNSLKAISLRFSADETLLTFIDVFVFYQSFYDYYEVFLVEICIKIAKTNMHIS